MVKSIFILSSAIAKTAKEIKAVEKKQLSTRNNDEYNACAKELHLLALKMSRMSEELKSRLDIHIELDNEINSRIIITPDEYLNVGMEIYELLK